MPSPVRCVVVALALAVTAGCTTASHPAAAPSPTDTAAPSATPAPGPTCPPVGPASFSWPLGVPTDLPRPPGGVLTAHRTTKDGLQIVEFSTGASLRDGVLYLVNRISKAGYTLGRGDAEPSEADAPFSRGSDVRGVYRMVSLQQCQTKWLMAVTTNATGQTGTPLLPYRKGPSPSPLPFG